MDNSGFIPDEIRRSFDSIAFQSMQCRTMMEEALQPLVFSIQRFSQSVSKAFEPLCAHSESFQEYVEALNAVSTERRRAFSGSLSKLNTAWQAFAERFAPGTVDGDIYILLDPDSAEEDKRAASKWLADGYFRSGVIGERGRALQRKARFLPRPQKLDIMASLLLAASVDNERMRAEQVINAPLRDMRRVFRLRFEDEYEKNILGKGRTKAEHAEDFFTLNDVPSAAISLDIELQIDIRETLKDRNTGPYIAAVIEAALSDTSLRAIAEKNGLSYAALRQAKVGMPPL